MRSLIVTDIHANLPALEAVLASPQARACQQIISLGDQVNYGPQPRQVLQTLNQHHAVILCGNHEDRFHHLDEPDFRQYNWTLLQWTWEQVKDVLPDMPHVWHTQGVLCTHAVPGNLYQLVYPSQLSDVLDTLADDVLLFISGHNHISWRVTHHGKEAVNPGSLGMWENGHGGMAPFAVLNTDTVHPQIDCYAVPYDTHQLIRAYLTSGCWHIAPEMTRMALTTMLHAGRQFSLEMMRCVYHFCLENHLSMGDRDTWRLADCVIPWHENISTQAYWAQLERDYL